MNEQSPKFDGGTIGRAKHFDALCDEFESQFSAGNRPSIESFLLQVDGPDKQLLLVELIAIEMHYRRQNGESIAFAEYQTRFPGLSVSRLEETIQHSEKAHSPKTPAADQPTIDTRQSHSTNGDSKLVKYFGDYELLDVIARGGMGIVYKARQVSLNRIVALKMILSGEFASKEEVDRFYSEAKAAALLDHPGIVPIYEVGEHEGKHFFSMTYVDGTSLASKLNEGPLEPMQAARTMLEVSQAVHYAHEHGVIHRDLKPSNILLDLQGRPRVTDFGLAKRLSEDTGMTLSGQVLGTPSYMPPEQAAGQINTIGPASDVYGLGAVLYSLATGRPPFQAASSIDTLRQVVEKEPVAPRQLNSAIPRDLETIILKCLEKSLPRRYATANELSDELQRFIQGRPIVARPISSIAKTWRWCHRQPVVASLIAAVFLSLVAGVSVSSYYAWEANRRAEKEKEAKKEESLARAESKRSEERTLIALKAADAARIDEARQAEVAKEKSKELRRALYVSDLKQIAGLMTTGNVQRVRELLERHERKDSAEEDLRSFDWYYWRRKVKPDTTTYDLKTPVEVMAASVDERFVAIGCTGGLACIFDVEKEQLLDQVYQIAEDHWSNIAIVDSIDEHRLFGFGRSGTFRVWDLTTKTVIISNPGLATDVATQKENPRPVMTRMPAAVSSDGRWMVACDPLMEERGFECLALWDTKNWTVHAVPRLNDGQNVFFSTADPRGKVEWDQPSEFLTSLDFTSIAGSSFNGELFVNRASATPEQALMPSNNRNARNALSGYGRTFVGLNQQMHSFGARNSPPIEDWGSSVFSVQLNGDGSTIAAAMRDGSVRTWQRDNQMAPVECLMQPAEQWKTHNGVARDVRFHPDGKSLLSVGDDGKWSIHSLHSSSQTLGQSNEGQAAVLRFGSWLGNGDIVLGHSNGKIEIWDPKKDQILSSNYFDRKDVSAHTILPKRGRIFLAGSAGKFHSWKVNDETDWLVPTDNLNEADLRVSSNGRFLTSTSMSNLSNRWHICDMDAAMRCLNPATKVSMAQSGSLSENFKKSLSIEGSILHIPYRDELLQLDGIEIKKWDLKTQKVLKSWKHDDAGDSNDHTQTASYEWIAESKSVRKREADFNARRLILKSADLCPVGQKVLLVYQRDNDQILTVLDLETGFRTHRVCLLGGSPDIRMCRFIDGTKLLLANHQLGPRQNEFVAVWDLNENSLQMEIDGLAKNVDCKIASGSFCRSSNGGSFCFWGDDVAGDCKLRWFDSMALVQKSDVLFLGMACLRAFIGQDDTLFAMVQEKDRFGINRGPLKWIKWNAIALKWEPICVLSGSESEENANGFSNRMAWDEVNQFIYLHQNPAGNVQCWSLVDGVEQESIPIKCGAVSHVALDEATMQVGVSTERPVEGSRRTEKQTSFQVGRLGQHAAVEVANTTDRVLPFWFPIEPITAWLSPDGLSSTENLKSLRYSIPGSKKDKWVQEVISSAGKARTLMSRNRKVIVQVDFDGQVRTWSRNELATTKDTIAGSEKLFVRGPAFRSPLHGTGLVSSLSDSGDRLSNCGGGHLACLDVSNGRWNDLPTTKEITCTEWSPDAKKLAVGFVDGSIAIYLADTNKMQTLGTGHANAIWSLAWVPDGKNLASGAGDGTIAIWDLNQGETRLALKSHDGAVRSLSFRDRGDLLISGGDDGFVRVYRAPISEPQQEQVHVLPMPTNVQPLQLATLTPEQKHNQSTRDWLKSLGVPFQLNVYGVSLAEGQTQFHDPNHIGIHSLTINGNHTLQDSDMERLSGLSTLHFLSLSGATRDGVARIDGLANLRMLNLNGIDLSELDFESIGINRLLVRLELCDTQLTDQQLATIVKLCPLLEVLDLTRTKVTDEGVKLLSQLRELQTLKLRSTSIEKTSIESLQELTALEVLDLSETNIPARSAFEGLTGLTNLRSISLAGLSCSDDDLAKFATQPPDVERPEPKKFMTQNDYRDYEKAMTEFNLASAPKFWTKLFRIDLQKTQISLDGLLSIFSYRPSVHVQVGLEAKDEPNELTTLLKMGPWAGSQTIGISDREVSISAAIPMLRQDGFVTAISWPQEKNDGQEQLDLLKDFRSLKEIRMPYGKIKPDLHFSLLAQLPNVTRLRLGKQPKLSLEKITDAKQLELIQFEGDWITDINIQQIAKLPNLRKIEVEDLRNISFAKLAQVLQGIRSLKVTEKKIDDKQFAMAISSLDRLESLELVEATMTIASIPQFKRLAGLKELTLVGTKIDKNSIRALQELLPECRVTIR